MHNDTLSEDSLEFIRSHDVSRHSSGIVEVNTMNYRRFLLVARYVILEAESWVLFLGIECLICPSIDIFDNFRAVRFLSTLNNKAWGVGTPSNCDCCASNKACAVQ